MLNGASQVKMPVIPNAGKQEPGKLPGYRLVFLFQSKTAFDFMYLAEILSSTSLCHSLQPLEFLLNSSRTIFKLTIASCIIN